MYLVCALVHCSRTDTANMHAWKNLRASAGGANSCGWGRPVMCSTNLTGRRPSPAREVFREKTRFWFWRDLNRPTAIVYYQPLYPEM